MPGVCVTGSMDFSTIILPLTGLLLAFVGLLVLTPRLMRDRKVQVVRKTTFEFPCSNCQAIVFITRQSLVKITGAEAALIIRNVPDAPMHQLAEQRCSACRSTLSFRIDEWPPVFLIANATEGQKRSNNCTECRKPLVRPNFAKGAYDERINEIPDLNPKLGLRCSRCSAVSCVACLESVTRNRTQDGSYLCPRCYRSPVNLVHHF